MILRHFINPEALERNHEEFHGMALSDKDGNREDIICVLHALTIKEIAEYIAKTIEIQVERACETERLGLAEGKEDLKSIPEQLDER